MRDSTDLAPLFSLLAPLRSQGRTALLPALHAAQAEYGSIPEAIAEEIGKQLNVPLADIHGVIDFYTLLYREPVGRAVVRVCTDPSCALRGGDEVLAAACRLANVAEGETAADGSVTVERTTCLGHCNSGVSVNVSTGYPLRNQTFAHVTAADIEAAFTGQGRTTADHYSEDYVGGDLSIITLLTPLVGFLLRWYRAEAAAPLAPGPLGPSATGPEPQ